MKPNYECPDCGAFLEDWGSFLRCPWTKPYAAHPGEIEGHPMLTCGRPYKDAKRTEISAPIRGKRLD